MAGSERVSNVGLWDDWIAEWQEVRGEQRSDSERNAEVKG